MRAVSKVTMAAGLATAAGLTMAALPTATRAQVRLGPEIVVADNVDFGIGGHAFFPLRSVPMEIGAFFDLYFPDRSDYFEIGGTWYYLFNLPENPNVVPKVGGGVTLGNFSRDSDSPGGDDSSNTEVGIHILGGLEFPMRTLQPFVEVGFGIGDIPDFLVRGGLAFAVGGG